MRTVNQLINLNSANATRLNGDLLSSVFFNFQGLITANPNIKRITCSMLNSEIPYSYYNVNIYNHHFRLNVDGTNYFVVITPGNYNANTLITELLTQMAILGLTTVSITLSSFTGKLTFTTTSPSMTILYTNNTANKFLGFSTTTNISGTTITAPYPLNLLYTLKIRISSTALVTNYLDSALSGSSNFLASFPVSAQNFGVILYENPLNIQSEISVRSLNGFDIQILDDYGNLINFNNIDWTATMLITTEYEEEQSVNPFLSNYVMPLQKFWGQTPNASPNQESGDVLAQDNVASSVPALPEEEYTQDQQTERLLQQQQESYQSNIPDENNLELLLLNKGIYT